MPAPRASYTDGRAGTGCGTSGPTRREAGTAEPWNGRSPRTVRLPSSGTVLVGDREREDAAASLRRHFVDGRLSLSEFGDRVELALSARSRGDLGMALHDLPPSFAQLPASVRALFDGIRWRARRGAVALALATAWVALDVVLLLAFLVALAAGMRSLLELSAFPLAWLLATFALWRIWRRGAAAGPAVHAR